MNSRRFVCDFRHELIASHELTQSMQPLFDNLPACVVNFTDESQPSCHLHRTNSRYIEVLTVKQITALTGDDDLHTFTGFREYVVEYACCRRMQRGFRLLNSNQRHTTIARGWLEQRSKNSGGTDGSIRHRLRTEFELAAFLSAIRSHCNGRITTGGIRINTDYFGHYGIQVQIHAGLVTRMLRTDSPQNVSEILARASQYSGCGGLVRRSQRLCLKIVELHAAERTC